jgi:hypothetical protein
MKKNMKKSTTDLAFESLRKPTAKCGSVMKDKKKYNRKSKHGEKY